jgi:RNA polymerase-binding transcription factor DksA
MAQTADVMKAELNKLRTDLYDAFQSTGQASQAPNSRTPENADEAAVKELTAEIERLVQHIQSIDKQLQEVCADIVHAVHEAWN